MNKKIIDILFCLICICLLFKFIPSRFWMLTLGGPVGTDWIAYPLLLGFLYTGYCQIRYGGILIINRTLLIWGGIYLGILFLSLLFGLWEYPYYDLILSGPVSQIPKLPLVLQKLQEWGISADVNIATIIWMFGRTVKGILFEFLYTFGGAYMIYCWYAGRGQHVLQLMKLAIGISLVIVLFFGVIDVFFQAGNDTAKHLLKVMNPYLHSINEGTDWSPSILWYGQVRSVFLEPSYFGMYMAFAFPFLWYWMGTGKSTVQKILWGILGTGLAFEIFLAQSRLALAVIFGEVLLLIGIVVYYRRRTLYCILGRVVLCFGVAFIGAMFFVAENIDDQAHKGLASTYIKENLVSVVDSEKAGKHTGSNQSRFTIMKTNLKIGLHHPVLGVGYSLRQAYITEYLPPDNELNNELKKWKNNQVKMGILRSGYPSLGEYYVRFAETGIVGLLLFLMPSVVLGLLFLKKIVASKYSFEVAPIIFCGIAFAGTAAVGFGDGLTLTWCYWFLLGVGYILVTDKNLLLDSERRAVL